MTHIPLDYETLRLVWWLLLGILLIGFAVTDGYDLGVGVLLPFAARTDEERRVMINLIGPTWEGNQVWLVLGGGAIFAAWPALYAASFSGFYLAMITILLALILRPVGFKFRGKIEDPRWRSTWDWALFIGGFVPALIFGVAVGNVLLGVPFGLDASCARITTATSSASCAHSRFSPALSACPCSSRTAPWSRPCVAANRLQHAPGSTAASPPLRPPPYSP